MIPYMDSILSKSKQHSTLEDFLEANLTNVECESLLPALILSSKTVFLSICDLDNADFFYVLIF